MTGDRLKLTNYVDKFIGTVRFKNDQFIAIVGYGDYKLGNTIISRVYYVKGLSHNLFSVRQFCDGGLEVAFRQHTFCLLTKASSTKSWLWHRRLNHLNFGTLNELARNDLVRCLPKLKYDKYHLCPSCQLDKSKKSSHPLKTVNTNTEILNTLHMDLYGPMRIESINKKKYILVIVDDYTRFGWRALNATVRYIRTDNGTEFVSKTLTEFFESVSITHNTSVPRSPQQNGLKAKADTYGYLCWICTHQEGVPNFQQKNSTGLKTNTMAPMHNGAGPEISALQSGRTRSELVNDPTTPSVPPSTKQLEELFQPLFVDDEEFPPAVQKPSVRVNAAQAPKIATGSPSTSIITESAPATKDHPLENVIGDLHHPVSTRQQIETDAMWCFFNEFLTHVEPKNYKQALEHSCWIKAMQDEIHEFKRLNVWLLVPCLDNILIIPLKWIFKIKLDEYGEVLKNKARLVAKGLQVSQNPRGIFINQSKFALKILKKYDFDNSTPIDTPMAERLKLDEDRGGKLIDPTRFHGMAKPTDKYLQAIKRIFRYLNGTIHMGLWYSKDSGFALKAFADADYAGFQDTRRSTSGFA
nr:hypothetical protein [Tanacetum cinerariifolium]